MSGYVSSEHAEIIMMIDDHGYFYTRILKFIYTITPFLSSHLYYNTLPFLSFVL